MEEVKLMASYVEHTSMNGASILQAREIRKICQERLQAHDIVRFIFLPKPYIFANPWTAHRGTTHRERRR